MADIQAPTTVINSQQMLPIDDLQGRRLMELQLLRALEIEMTALDPTRGFEIR